MKTESTSFEGQADFAWFPFGCPPSRPGNWFQWGGQQWEVHLGGCYRNWNLGPTVSFCLADRIKSLSRFSRGDLAESSKRSGADPQGFPMFFFSSPTAESFGVSAQIGSGVVRGCPEVLLHGGSTRVPRGSVSKKEYRMLLGYHLSLFFLFHIT